MMDRIPSFVAWFWRGCTAVIIVLAIYTHLWVALIIYPLVALALELAYRRSRRHT